MTKSIVLTIIGVFSFSFLMAQQSGNVNRKSGNVNKNGNLNYKQNKRKPQGRLPHANARNNRFVELDVQVLSNQKADAYVAIFNLTQMGKTLEETNNLLNDRFNGFSEELQRVGIPKSDIYLDMVTFAPLYEYEVEKKLFTKTHNEVPKGFEMQQNVHIKYKAAKMMNDIIRVAAKYEIFDLVKVDYSVANQEAVFLEMRNKAVDHVVKQIELYIEKLGVDLESGYRIVGEDKKVVFPTDRYSSYQASSNVSLDKEIDTKNKDKVKDMYKPQTIFYDKVNYDEFDIVINPAPLQPPIQFMYNMKVRIAVTNPNEPAKEYIWLTPEGDKVPIEVTD